MDRTWVHGCLAELRTRYAEVPKGLPDSLVHGDAGIGDAVSIGDGEFEMLRDIRESAWPAWRRLKSLRKSGAAR